MQAIRWQQRFDTFIGLLPSLRDVQERGMNSLSQLAQEGAMQRFEFAYELAWKTLKTTWQRKVS